MQGTKRATWELRVIVVLIVALSAAADAAAFLRFAPSLGLPDWAGALCVLPVKLVEWRFLKLAWLLWRTGWLGKLLSPAFVLGWMIAVGLSMLAAHSTVYTLFAGADRDAAMSAETRANIVMALERTNAQLDAFHKPLPRPAKTVEQELGWATSVSAPPRNCVRLVDEPSREACRKVKDLRKELAAATDFERLVEDEKVLREKLAGLRIEAVHDPMPHAFEMTIGRLLDLDGKNGISLMAMLILGLGSALGPFALDLIGSDYAGRARAPFSPKPAAQISGKARQASGQVLQFPFAHLTRGKRTAHGQAPEDTSAGASSRQEKAGARRGRDGQTAPAKGSGEGAHPPGQRVDHGQAAAAVNEFVRTLVMGKEARASGSALYDAYTRQRLVHGWPSLQPNVFGIHVKAAVIKTGGRKLKSGVQIYEGVAVPASWAADGAAASARAA